MPGSLGSHARTTNDSKNDDKNDDSDDKNDDKDDDNEDKTTTTRTTTRTTRTTIMNADNNTLHCPRHLGPGTGEAELEAPHGKS